eukprot:7513-Heterococcus_DN1.PRE.1
MHRAAVAAAAAQYTVQAEQNDIDTRKTARESRNRARSTSERLCVAERCVGAAASSRATAAKQ